MTTAHRPTWKAAVGKSSEGGFDSGGALSTMRSSKDATAHTKLKFRGGAQTLSKAEVIERSLKALSDAETKGGVGRRGVDEQLEREAIVKATQKKEVDVKVLSKYDDGSDDEDGVDFGDKEEEEKEEEEESDLDGSDEEDSDSDDESDDEDEEAALAAELAKIRKEKEESKRLAEEKVKEEEDAKLTEAAMLGNPLLQSGGSGGKQMKRKWNDDVVFRNQAKKEPDQNTKRFINDTVRNDFHKRFMDKFMK